MFSRIENIAPKLLIGKYLSMSHANNKTYELWSSFMPELAIIQNRMSTDLISMQIYPKKYSFIDFNLHDTFEKWATTEVTSIENRPLTMDSHTLEGGLHAVFIHKGSANDGYKTFQYIFESWLPNSEYELDQRPHFEILGARYKNNDPDSEEEIWIPIKHK